MTILDDLRRLFADAEVSLVGAREERIEAERALEARDWFRARAAARRILDRAPHSPIALALLADACEGACLDAELEDALGLLARVAGSSPDIWLRLGRVRIRVNAPPREVREAVIRALAWSDDLDPEKRWSARQARLLLADLDLFEGNPVRAEGWLAPLDDGTDVRRRRLACMVARRATNDVARLLPGFEPEISDAEGQRLLGEAHRLLGNASAAVRALARAAILNDEKAVDALREAVAVATSLDEGALRAAETVAEELGVHNTPLWRAALSAARGEARVAAVALRDVALTSFADRAAARAVAINAQDVALLRRAESTGELAEIDRIIIQASSATPREGLDQLLLPITERTEQATAEWLRLIARGLVERIAPSGETADWPLLLERLGGHARALADLESLRRLELVAAERARPVRIAIVGEFNAGKSTFVNALLGMEVAPTGILPTTAVPHVLKYGPDPIARVRLKGGGARTVAPDRLKSVLAESGSAGGVSEVEVEVPFAYLQRVEIVDTPGFNAPDPAHAKAAMDSLVEGPGVDVAIWLFDVGQPLKTSERRVLEAILARGIPVQALLNKADRLTESELATVMTQFVTDAASIGLTSWRPPLAFSARAAVAARIANDREALDKSGFTPVRALLEDELAEHGDTLKERGLRRRAYDVVVPMRVAADEAHRARVAALSSRAEALGTLLAQAGLLDRAAAIDAGATTTPADQRADEIRRGVRTDLRDALDAFRRERDELAAKDHPTMAPYLERRLIEHLEVSAGRTIAGVLSAEGGSLPLDEIAHDASTIARGFAAGGIDVVEGKKAGRARGDVEGPLVRALLRTVAGRLRATSEKAADSATATLPRARELSVFAEVLAPPGAVGAQHASSP